MEKRITEETKEDVMNVSTLIRELEKDLPVEPMRVIEKKVASGKEAILEILARAADDHKFLARLAENPSRVLQLSLIHI